MSACLCVSLRVCSSGMRVQGSMGPRDFDLGDRPASIGQVQAFRGEGLSGPSRRLGRLLVRHSHGPCKL